MIENITQLAEKGGLWAGVAIVLLAILRAMGMKASQDAVTLKGDRADLAAFNRLLQRVNHLDGRVNELENVRSHLFRFTTQCMAYISQCRCIGTNPPTKADLYVSYQKLLHKLTEHFNGK